MPRFPDRFEPGPAPPVRKDGLFATAGLPDPEPPPPGAAPFVAIAVGKTKDGASLPANPRWGTVSNRCTRSMAEACTELGKPSAARSDVSDQNVKRLELAYLSMTTAGVWLAMLARFEKWMRAKSRRDGKCYSLGHITLGERWVTTVEGAIKQLTTVVVWRAQCCL